MRALIYKSVAYCLAAALLTACMGYGEIDPSIYRSDTPVDPPTPPTSYTDLSSSGTANCYIVSSKGGWKFKATVKGNSTESVGTPTKAEVLWETFGTSTKPSVGDVVSGVSYSGGYVSFSSGKDGNAVIAVKDASGNILWSWHIWVCEGYDPKANQQTYNNGAGIMMDRNLGATSASKGSVGALGLLYQWGRKDPFLGGCQISYSSDSKQQKASSTLSWPSAVSSSSSTGIIAYAVSHPTTFITYNSSNYDWYYTGSSSTDNTRWQSSKTKYDPCPPGYRVPDGGDNGVWSTAFGTSSGWTTSSNWDSTNMGMNFGSTDRKLGSGVIWYPAAGYLGLASGSLSNVGTIGNYWSCTPNGYYAYYLFFFTNGYVIPSDYYYRASGQSVRCLSESSTPVVAVTSVELDKSSATLSPGGTLQLTASVLPSNATVKTLTWSTSDNSVAKVSDNGLVTAVSNGSCIITATANNGMKAECSVTIKTVSYTDLSSSGTANCYIVSSQGGWKFKATVKGNSSESVGSPSKAEVLWETFGTSTKPNVGDVVSNVSYSGGYVSFTSGKDGNAVIAVKDASGNILWSWHIWVCEGYDPKATQQTYNNNAGIMMDRNLGATSASKGSVGALGLLYQWGRKDPFLGGQSISSSTAASSTLSWPSAVSSSSSTGTIAYAVSQPTTLITSNNSNYDWYYTGSSSTDDTRWQSSKTKYDPCPPGYRVPDGGSSGVWPVAFGTSSYWTTSSNWDSTNKGMNFGSTDKKLGSGVIWYPAAGYLHGAGGLLKNVDSYGGHWSCSPDGYYAYYLYFYNDGGIYPSVDHGSRAYGRSVRCLSESSTPVVAVTSVELDKSSATLSPGGTLQISASVLPSNANVKTLTWSSSDSNVATVSDTGLLTAVANGSCTITATAYNGVKAECQVTVENAASNDLSAFGTANCYIVSSKGDWKFKATVKGNSTESVGSPTKAEVLWETFGTSTTPSVGDIVSNVSYSGGYVSFSSGKDGNAVIAVKDASGNILWSWHIWVCEGYDPKATQQTYNNNAGVMMDRNLGATSASKGSVGALGLLYQWGRKDPFLGSSNISSRTVASSTLSWPSSVESTSSTGTIAYAVSHPTTFIRDNSKNIDWYYTGSSSTDNTRWQSSKTKYDPCPLGYRVPDGGSSGVWSTAFGTSGKVSSNWDTTNKGMDFGSTGIKLGSGVIWYPAAGYIADTGYSPYTVGERGYYWSCTPDGNYAYYLDFGSSGSVYPSDDLNRAGGRSVRCLSESK